MTTDRSTCTVQHKEATAHQLGALMFLLAAASTFATATHSLPLRGGALVGIFGALLTLAGLCLVAFGAHDERPLSHAPATAMLLLVGAVAAIVQSLVLFTHHEATSWRLNISASAPYVGLTGGSCVCIATCLLLARRNQRPAAVGPSALIGLALIGVGATVANVVWVLQSGAVSTAGEHIAQIGIASTAAGELLIAVELWRGRSAASHGAQQPPEHPPTGRNHRV